MPAGNSGTVYCPAPVVTVEFCVPIAVLVTVTFTPVIPEPDGSMTVPDTLPRSLCALANGPANQIQTQRAAIAPIINREQPRFVFVLARQNNKLFGVISSSSNVEQSAFSCFRSATFLVGKNVMPWIERLTTLGGRSNGSRT